MKQGLVLAVFAVVVIAFASGCTINIGNRGSATGDAPKGAASTNAPAVK